MADETPAWMIPCPECGVPIEPGQSPLGLARHSCDYVKGLKEQNPTMTTLERAREATLLSIMQSLDDMRPEARTDTLRALYEMGAITPGEGAGAGVSPALEAWIMRTETEREVD